MALSFEASKAEYEEIAMPPTEAEWLALRKPWWNASLAGCLIPSDDPRTGCEHPYISLGDAVTEKLRPDFEVFDEDRMKLFRRGLAMEPYIASVVTELSGYKLIKPGFMTRRGPMLCTPDYRVDDKPEVGVEIKSTQKRLGAVVPRYWFWQCQAQCWCEDWERVTLGALDASLEVRLFEVERDDDAIKRLIDAAAWLVESLDWGVVPQGVQLSAGNVSALWPKDDGQAEEVPPEAVEHVSAYLKARDNEKLWKAEKERRRDKVAAMLGEHGTATVAGTQIASYKATKDVDRFDWKRYLTDHPAECAPYVDKKPGARRFLPNEKGLAALLPLIGVTDDGTDNDW